MVFLGTTTDTDMREGIQKYFVIFTQWHAVKCILCRCKTEVAEQGTREHALFNVRTLYIHLAFQVKMLPASQELLSDLNKGQ